VAKWTASMAPEPSISSQSHRARPRSSSRRVVRVTGARIRDASVSRQAAIASEFTSAWASRMMGEAVEAARTPTTSARWGGKCTEELRVRVNS
jgi:hypothetical protein